MTQAEKAQRFADLHRTGDPLVLYNIWDAGSARAAVSAGAPAVATGSWSVAAAQGFQDGEHIPLDLLLTIAERIAANVDVPVSIDFEGGYTAEPDRLAANVTRLIATGAVGINFEDRIVAGEGLFSTKVQAARIAAIRQAADAAGIPLFINARTDHFLAEPDRSKHAALLSDALDRAAAYAEAGASGFFVPGLTHPDLIADVCETVSLPVNVMALDGMPDRAGLAGLGVARISHGPGPYRTAMKTLEDRCQEAMARSLL
ncbi:isocitrate lyase/PEP mutase family protein [Hyphobacterium marinum]|uniref:Isocitrate lyase/phosphoenolpyruvate mutase family protein n=1 Tax=Hyphobacterium marinum TaxID=3116574 RepID=A0ABU7LXJ5_9PROT|nr:isocitrate lyase/phosphoenolpyruvate mutase family protein [Hyphobacterium sp. Y6023]MEE2566284.1 isocitrate lyase/phosphoenolpyruvate mutase family protein [Hyphobacterium sp. Y6023]